MKAELHAAKKPTTIAQHRWKKVMLAVGAVTLIAFTALWEIGGQLCAPCPAKIGNLPLDMRGDNVEFSSASGSTIHGWFLSGKKNQGAVILMHAIRGNRLTMLERARFLNQRGYGVLLFDFQAHGESLGQHLTFGYLESEDAKAAVA